MGMAHAAFNYGKTLEALSKAKANRKAYDRANADWLKADEQLGEAVEDYFKSC
jgi:hypothetical protein